LALIGYEEVAGAHDDTSLAKGAEHPV
jgi:hypothetical protein